MFFTGRQLEDLKNPGKVREFEFENLVDTLSTSLEFGCICVPYTQEVKPANQDFCSLVTTVYVLLIIDGSHSFATDRQTSSVATLRSWC